MHVHVCVLLSSDMCIVIVTVSLCLVQGFAELGMSSESKALRSIFFGQVCLSLPPSLPPSLTTHYFPQTECRKNRFSKPVQEPQRLAVLGAGLMGAGIVQVQCNPQLNVLEFYTFQLICVHV